jgi:hypothetical protein
MRLHLTTALTLILFSASALAQEAQDQPPEPQPDEKPAFEIVHEAELPEEWPAAGPAFEVAVKEYPAYRAAYAEGRGAFFLLFAHIQTNEIPMTAPVEMEMKQAPRGYEMVNMGFLYQSQDVGETGKKGPVEVVDVPAMTVVSFGTNGPIREATWQDALDQIEATINALEDWQSTGKLRMLGYNSPMIPENQRYYEIQVIIERIDNDEEEPADPDHADDPAEAADE